MGAEQRGNAVLGTLLGELGWSPQQLAGVVNGALGPSYVARSTVSEWLNQDRLPREPLPTVVAHLISDALDRGDSFATLANERRSITVTSAMVDAVAAGTAGISTLGGVEGGNSDTLRFLHHHLLWVTKLLRQGRFTSSAVANRLLTEWAHTAQVGAWMANEAGQHGLSQRYVTSGLHAAHTAGDRTVGVYLLAFASKWRVIQGGLNDGVDLGRAARDAAELANAAYEVAKSTPSAPRALAASAMAAAQAAVGNAHGFHTAADEARALLDTPGGLDALPSYLTGWAALLESQLALSALTLAEVSSRDCRRLVEGADTVLGRIATDPESTPWDAVFHNALLSRAHVAADNLDRAVPAAQTALRRLPTVRSRRCALILRRLADDLAALPPTRQPATVRSLHDQLRAT